MAQTPIFNPKRRKLLRSHVPMVENLSTLALFGVLAGIIVWVALQKGNYNPADRDIAAELLRDPNPPKLYAPPVKPWTAPGATATAEIPELGPFPSSILDSDWQPAARVKQFNADNLYEKINGEAEKFLKQGFQALHYIVLKSRADGSEIAIELYDQGDTKGSMGIFAEHLSGDQEIEQNGEVVFFRTGIGLIGRKGRFFFRVAGDREAEEIRLKARRLAEAFSQLPDSEADAPAEFRLLKNSLGIAAELITYQSSNVFQYDFAKDFWFGSFRQGDPERVFIHLAATPEAARQLFGRILEEQSYEYEPVEQNAQQAVLRHEYLQNYFAIMQQGRFIFGLENAADKDRIAAIQQQLLQELAGEQ